MAYRDDNLLEPREAGDVRQLPPGDSETGTVDDADLKILLRQLSNDASQLAHDELTLAKMEIRDIADAFSSDIQTAGQTVVRDMAKVGIALSLATLAGLALTAGAVMGIGALLGGAYWAGGLIVGTILMIAAAAFGMSAAKDLRESEALRMENARRTLERDKDMMQSEARETQRFASESARDFKDHASPPENPTSRSDTIRH